MARKKLPKHKTAAEREEALVWSWQDRGWIAQIIENEDGGGWAITMTREGDSEPVYEGPWTMGRNKIDPKPLDQNAFNTWVKSASEFLMRAQSQVRDSNRLSFTVSSAAGETIHVVFDVIQDEYEPEGVLTASDVYGNELARVSVHPRYRLTYALAEEWVAQDFAPPSPPEEPEAPLAEDSSTFEDATLEDLEEREAEEVETETELDAGEGDGAEDEVAYEEEYVEEYEEPTFEYDS